MTLFHLVKRSNFNYVVLAHLFINRKYYYFDAFIGNQPTDQDKLILETNINFKSIEPYNPIHIHSRV